jgi:hypothetical protein
MKSIKYKYSRIGIFADGFVVPTQYTITVSVINSILYDNIRSFSDKYAINTRCEYECKYYESTH